MTGLTPHSTDLRLAVLVWTWTAVMATVAPPAKDFQIGILGTSGCHIINPESLIGDDRGGIALGTDVVFATGDSGTARLTAASDARPWSVSSAA